MTKNLARFTADRDSVYLAMASASGRPYVRHHGGPKRFILVVGKHTSAGLTSTAIRVTQTSQRTVRATAPR